ncbi:MAG: phage minor head protein [Victivallaceae bacterium]|nr:phage minor head protein [Victivallaceae bacterium]
MSNYLLTPTPAEEALKFLANKKALSRSAFERLLPELRARAICISGVQSLETVRRVLDRIKELPAGGDWQEIKKGITRDVSPFLVDPFASNEERAEQVKHAEARAELLIRTHGFQSYQAVSYASLDENRDVFPAWKYLTAGDDRVRPEHVALNGLILPCNSPFWSDHFPPWNWGCRCSVVGVSADELTKAKARDSKRLPEEALVVEGARLRKLEENGTLLRAMPGETMPQIFDCRAPRATMKEGAYYWNPADLRLSLDMLRDQYASAPDVFAMFEEFAKSTDAGGVTVWQWLNGETIPTKTTISIAEDPKTQKPEKTKAPAAVEKISTVGLPHTLAASVRSSLRVVDSTLAFPKLPELPVLATHETSTLGAFAWNHIEVSVLGSHPELTMSHEFGHLIDHEFFGKGFHGLGTRQNHEELAPLMETIKNSGCVRGIKNLIGRKFVLTTKLDSGGSFKSTKETDNKHARYLVTDEELFARAFAQYMASKSGDFQLVAQVEALRAGKLYGLSQWSQKQFAPIKEEFDKLFAAKGWLKP